MYTEIQMQGSDDVAAAKSFMALEAAARGSRAGGANGRELHEEREGERRRQRCWGERTQGVLLSLSLSSPSI